MDEFEVVGGVVGGFECVKDGAFEGGTVGGEGVSRKASRLKDED